MMDAKKVIEELLQATNVQAIYVLSPHLDDAIWSLGSILEAIAATGQKVKVITVFSRTTEMPIRKAEDRRVLKIAGCDVQHLDFADAILDGRPVEAAFDEAYMPDDSAARFIARRMQEVISESRGLPESKAFETAPENSGADADTASADTATLILAPSGFGVHVDHLMTRAATAYLPGRGHSTGRVIYYEDLPYAARSVRLANAQKFLASRGLHRQTIPTTSEMIERHLYLYNLYTSQRQDHHVEQIRNYLQTVGFGVWL